ncbi:MAG: hypothetical protein QME75_01855 [Deltaproteobacteria bacterium]|nr:hypothetical protein [Deltaproteobacteria bacterium]
MCLLLCFACAPAPTDQELQKDVQSLKTEVAALKQQIDQLKAGQKQIQDTLKEMQEPGEPAAPMPPPAEPSTAGPSAAPSPKAISLSQLLQDKDRLTGTRVTVKGTPGPVMMHKKTLYLQAPEGMLEVFFGDLQDKKQIERLGSQSLEEPITVTGLLTRSPGTGYDPSRLRIVAESVDF